MAKVDRYIVVGPLRVDDISGSHPDIIAGYPMPTAVAGLGYKVVLDLNAGLNVDSLQHAGTSVIVHEHSMHSGHPKNPVENIEKIRKKQGAPIVDEFKARAVLSIVIALTSRSDDDFEDADVFDRVREAVARNLPGWFFGGGKVFLPDGRTALSLVQVAEPEELTAALRRLPAGNVLFDRADLLEDRTQVADDTLEALLDLIEAVPLEVDTDGKPAEDGRKKYTRLLPGWLVPILVGYQGIERPRLRLHSRIRNGVTPHVYAESLYSLGEYKSLRTLLATKASQALEGCFWSHRYNKVSETFYVSAIETV